MSIEFIGDMECFSTVNTNTMAADGSSQSRCLGWKWVYGQNVVMMILLVSGLGVARVNHNAVSCILVLHQKHSPVDPYKTI